MKMTYNSIKMMSFVIDNQKSIFKLKDDNDVIYFYNCFIFTMNKMNRMIKKYPDTINRNTKISEYPMTKKAKENIDFIDD